MRISLLAFCVSLLVACKPVTNVTLSSQDQKDIKALVQGAFDDLWGGLDTIKLLDYHTEDFVILEHGEIWTNEEVMNYMRKSLAKNDSTNRINKMEFIDMNRYGNAITMSYHNYASFLKNDSLVDKAQWLESATAVSTPNGWRLKEMHSTWVPIKE
jgi:hypothetical protein